MYLIMEIQKAADGTAAFTPVIQREDWNEAKSEFHRVSSVACVSAVPKHIVALMSDDFEVITKEISKHPVTEE